MIVYEKGIAFSPDSTRLALLFEDRVWVLALPSLEVVGELPLEDTMEMYPGGRMATC